MKDGADLLLFQENCECVAASPNLQVTAAAASVLTTVYCFLPLNFLE